MIKGQASDLPRKTKKANISNLKEKTMYLLLIQYTHCI